MPASPRRPRTIACCLLGGAAATVLVAWFSAALPLDHTLPPVPLSADPSHPWDRTNAIAFCRYPGRRYEWVPLVLLDPQTSFDDLRRAWRTETEAVFNAPPGVDLQPYWGVIVEPYAWPTWASLPQGRAADSGLQPDQGLSIDARGFPLPAFRCFTIMQGPSTRPTPHPVNYAITLRAPTGAINDGWMALPLQPIPLNFALDTLFYAAVLFAAPRVYAAARDSLCQGWRRRRGLCPRCAYNLAGNTTGICPECGATLKASPQ